jgi:replicative DNA helicase
METEQSEVNTLKKFGNVFQSKCIAILISDRAFLERIIDIILPDYFETDAQKWIIKLITNYFPQYREIPTMEVFKVEIQNIADEVLKVSVFEQVKAAYKNVSSTDTDYVKETFLEFCRNQKLKNAIWDAHNFLKHGDYDSIWHVINEASRAGIERNLGHNYFDDIDQRMCSAARDTVKTNWDIIDTHLDGGLGKGELGFIVAPAGSGKSWFLARIGAEAMKQGKNVIHITLELNEKYVGLRYDAIFSGIAFQEVRKNTEVVRSHIEEMKAKGGGKLFIKYFPIKTASAATIKMYIDRLQLITSVKVDLVVVDYADLLRPFAAEKNSNSYSEAGSVYEELRGILGELQVPGWTASQSNRGAHEEDIIEAHNVADSYRKIMTGDFIMSLSRKMEDKLAGTGRIHVMKNRFGSDGVTYPCEFDTSCGKINIYDAKSIEGMEVLGKVKSAQEGVQDILRKRWNETHNNDSDSD